MLNERNVFRKNAARQKKGGKSWAEGRGKNDGDTQGGSGKLEVKHPTDAAALEKKKEQEEHGKSRAFGKRPATT